jgi:Tol biopolymer transport system component
VLTLAWAAALAAGCGSGDNAGVDLPALEIRTTTSGTELDPDGYTVSVDGGTAHAMGLVDSLVVDPLPAGDHSVTLGGMADNCAVAGSATVTATVAPATTATVSYAVVCGPTHGGLVVTTATTGETLDPDGYQLQVDETGQGPLGLNDSRSVGGLAAGDHQVALKGVAANCTVEGENPRTVPVTPGADATVAFAVTCANPVGRIHVDVTTSGAPQDPDGYTVAVDGAGAGTAVGTTGSVDLDGVPVGEHDVALNGLASNCIVQSVNPVRVTVPLAGADTASFAVSCLGDSQVIAFTGNAPGVLAVFVVSPDGTGLANLTPDPLLERDPVWSPDGRRLLVVRVDPSFTSEALYVMNADGSERTPLAEAPTIVDYRWSPDGTQIAFSLGRIDQGLLVSDLWVMKADGTGKLKLASNGESPTWSPDGGLIAYVHDVGNLHLRIVGAGGGGDHRLTDETMNTIQPTWSPDGSRIAFVSLDPNEIRVIDPDGTGLLNLTQGQAQEDGPVWSPDGARLAINSGPTDQPLESEVVTLNPDGTGRVTLTNHPGFDLSPDWSPDGQRIVYVRSDDGDNEIYVMNSDGSDPVNVSHRPGSFESSPDWGGRPGAARVGPLARLNTTWSRLLRLRHPGLRLPRTR